MIDAFGRGALAGYGIAIPVGAIAVLIVTTAARESFRRGAAAGLGAASADTVYATVAVVTGSALSARLVDVRSLLHVLGGGILVVVALRGLMRSFRVTQTSHEPPRPTGHSVIYARFLGLTLINPLTVVYFSSIVLGDQAALAGAHAVAFVAGVAVASASWQMLLAASGALLGRRLIDQGRSVAAWIGYGLILSIALDQLSRI